MNEKLMNAKLTREEFYSKVKDSILENLDVPEGTEVSIQQIVKSNDIKLTALIVKIPEKDVTPMIYLEEAYKDYKYGKDFGDIMKNVAKIYERNNPKSTLDIGLSFAYDDIKDKLAVQVLEIRNNRERIENLVSTRVGNGFAAIYKIVVGQDAKGMYAAPITKQMASEMNYDMKTLMEDAFANMQKNNPAVFVDLERAAFDVLAGTSIDEQLLSPELAVDKDSGAFVLSNANKLDGATALWYPDTTRTIGDLLGKDYYVIPSSMHELIVMPKDGKMELRDIQEMVLTVNANAVSREDFLSDKVLGFSRDRGELFVASDPHRDKDREER